MTGRERVKRALHFEGPDRVPFWGKGSVDFTPEVTISSNPHWVMPPEEELKKLVPDFKGRVRMNEWGVISGSLNDFKSGEVIRPGLLDWADWSPDMIPDIDNPERFVEAKKVLDADNEDRYHLIWFGGLYTSHLYDLRGVTEFLVDTALNKDKILEFNEALEVKELNSLKLWKEAGAHGFLFGNDMGLQDRLLFSAKTWREIYKPFYKRFIEAAHELGLDVWMHSCGYIWDIIPDFIEIGLDAINMDQVNLLGIDRLSAECGGKICFYNPIDIQATLPTGDREKIRAEAKKQIEKLGSFNGGFIAKDYPQPWSIGISDEVMQMARDAFYEFGDYSKRLYK
ncbi:uroporphyrinogen decarboxylase family protein [Mahella australiensis]|uniref:Uroporphyrinogen decarboxylase (URO-D) domain-containing protein n=1 Tax=Mahella australiensis (strain DSM 15567 / CIP 107919 / 50-1 BON) TaxID=697281 RepID=F3ZZ43_MAHA5|nr:uroporphyrinogen decarboxylase family protein [Mahella australiensis]AEE97825.1 hypothetical protein Mahau_2689 [Mahella australiensis 50-1 BON]